MNLRLTWIIYGAPVYKQNLLNVLYFCPLTNFTCSSRLHHLRLIFRLRTILTVIKIIFLNPVYLELLNSRSDTKPSESRNPFPPWSLPPWKGPFCHGMKDEYGHTGVDDSHWAPTCHSAKVSSPLACSVFVFIISSRRYFMSSSNFVWIHKHRPQVSGSHLCLSLDCGLSGCTETLLQELRKPDSPHTYIPQPPRQL